MSQHAHLAFARGWACTHGSTRLCGKSFDLSAHLRESKRRQWLINEEEGSPDTLGKLQNVHHEVLGAGALSPAVVEGTCR